MNNVTVPSNDIHQLAHVDLFALMADVLRGPDGDLPMHQASALLGAAGLDDDHACVRAWRVLQQQIGETDLDVWSVEHHRLFEGATACPPNQTAYIRRDKGAVIGDLCGFYQAFHLSPTSETGEKPDHIVTQIEFLSLLMVMRTGATTCDDDEPRQVATEAARAFADDHMAPWLGLFCEQLRRCAALPLYHALADVIDHTWAALAHAHGWAGLTVEADDIPIGDVEPPADDCGDLHNPLVSLRVEGRPASSPPTDGVGR